MIRTLAMLLLLAVSSWAQGQVFYTGTLDFHYSQLFGPFNGDFSVEGAIDTSQWIPELEEGLGGAIFAADTTSAQQLLMIGAERVAADDTTYNVFGLLYRSPDQIDEGSVANATSTVTLFLLWRLDSLALPDFTDSLDLQEILGALSAEHKFVGAATAMNIQTLDATSLDFSFSGILVDMESSTTIVTLSNGVVQLDGFDVSVADPTPLLPSGFMQVSPNPFNPSTQVAFRLQDSGPTILRVHDVSGRLVDEVDLGWLVSGQQQVQWHASSQHGCATGMYVMSLWQRGNLLARQGVLLIK